jgi:hypothetical protein
MIEINALADLDRIALALPAPAGPQLRASVGGYLRSVIDHDMAAMAEGRISEPTNAAYGRLWSTVAHARKDSSLWEETLLGRAFDKVGVVGDQRRVRILASTQSLPMIVWAILLMGGAIILSGATMVSLRYGSPAREVMMAVAVMLSIVLYSIYAMDRPFRHGFAPGVTRYELLWQSYHSAEQPASAIKPTSR